MRLSWCFGDVRDASIVAAWMFVILSVANRVRASFHREMPVFFQKRKNEQKRREEQLLRRIEQRQAENVARAERKICADLARGNISLQFGDFVTSRDLDNLQEYLADYFLKNRKTESA